MPKVDEIDLRAAISVLTRKFPAIESIHIFGSRRYKTDSIRSDIDLLITTTERIKPVDLREHILERCTALDLFMLEGNKATSIANESFIEDESSEALIDRLGALKLFDRDLGMLDSIADFTILPLDKRVIHKLSSLPNLPDDAYEVQALIKYFQNADRDGLPIKPYLGQSALEVAELLIEITSRMIDSNQKVTGHGQANSGWTIDLKDEYDFQNLFWITIKPWLPGLGREEIEIIYDDNKKLSDFNLFKNQITIELKHIKDDNDKRNIVKTL